MRVVFALLTLAATASAFMTGSSFAGSAIAAERASTSASTITMARNPLKAMKIRTRRLTMNEKDKLRISVFRSNNHIYAQVINDLEGTTLASASSRSLEAGGSNKAAAFEVGKALAEAAKAKGVTNLYFDRESASHKYMYHGRVASLIDGVREGGIEL